jgi:hypothetical protein
MSQPDPHIALDAIFEIIENQKRDGDPPEAGQTYDRLIRDGHSHNEAMRMIGCVLSNEMFHIAQR